MASCWTSWFVLCRIALARAISLASSGSAATALFRLGAGAPEGAEGGAGFGLVGGGRAGGGGADGVRCGRARAGCLGGRLGGLLGGCLAGGRRRLARARGHVGVAGSGS